MNMNVNVNFFHQIGMFVLKEKILPSLTAQHKKILTIVLAALSCLTACYVIYFRYCKEKNRVNTGNTTSKIKKVDDQGIENKTKSIGEKILNPEIIERQQEKTTSDIPLISPDKLNQKSVENRENEIKEYMISNEEEYLKFLNEQVNGYIKFVYQGDVYIGEVKNSYPHGKGKITFSDQKTGYEGEFEKGISQGKGKMFSELGVIEGEFKNNQIHGKAKVTHPDGFTMEGDFIDSSLNGYGKVSYPNGTTFEAQFKDGIPLEGNAKKTHADGRVDEGEFKSYVTQDMGNYKEYQIYDGNIKISLADGTIFEGEINDCDIHGEGILKDPSGLVFKGRFSYNSFVEGTITNAKGVVLEASFTGNEIIEKFKIKLPEGTFIKGKINTKLAEGTLVNEGNIHEELKFDQTLTVKFKYSNGREVIEEDSNYDLTQHFPCFNSKYKLVNMTIPAVR